MLIVLLVVMPYVHRRMALKYGALTPWQILLLVLPNCCGCSKYTLDDVDFSATMKAAYGAANRIQDLDSKDSAEGATVEAPGGGGVKLPSEIDPRAFYAPPCAASLLTQL